MNPQQQLNADERSAIMMRGSVWAYNFLLFALLIDIVFRAVVRQEAAWDLFALIFASGVISMVYAARYKLLILSRESAVVMALVAIVAAIVAFVIAMAKAM
jgi:hypothetical protein